MAAEQARRHDLDWIRVCAFGLLILYHVGMFYVPWDWHVKSPRPIPALEPVMLLTNPWRLTLLFLVSGAATRFLYERFAREGAAPARRLGASRTLRLLPPLVLAIFVVVPPQSYYEVYEALQAIGVAAPARHPWMHDFWLRYATGAGRWCDAQGCLATPTWNHMWFVAYLLVYGWLVALTLPAVAPRLPMIQAALERGLRGPALLLWPIVWLGAIRLSLASRFPITDALIGDWYNHALSFSAYGFGFLTARSVALKTGFVGLRRPALALGVVAWAVVAGAAWIGRGASTPPAEAVRIALRCAYAIDQWAFIAAALGYGARYLDRGGPLLAYLTAGVFPAYLIHQTIIVVAGHNLATVGLPLALEAGLLVALTLAGCWLTYEIARRIGWAGLLLGLSPRRPCPPRRSRGGRPRGRRSRTSVRPRGASGAGRRARRGPRRERGSSAPRRGRGPRLGRRPQSRGSWRRAAVRRPAPPAA
jgi:hypothetical protein